MAITEILEESEMIDAGAPSIKYEGERPLKKQEMLMAGPDWYIKRMEILMDEYGYDYDEAGEIAYDSDKYYEVIGIDPGGIGDESRNMDEEVVEEEGIMRAANGGITPQLVRKNQDGSRPGYRGAGGYRGGSGGSGGKSGKEDKASSSGAGISDRDSARERAISNRFKGPGGTTKKIDRDAPTEPPKVFIDKGDGRGAQPYNVGSEQANFAASIVADKKRVADRKKRQKDLKFLEDTGKLGYTRRTKDSNLQNLGLLSDQPKRTGLGSLSLYGGVQDAFKVSPETAMFDIDSMREIYNPMSAMAGKKGITKQQTKDLQDLRQDMEIEQKIMDDTLTNKDFLEYRDRNKTDTPSDNEPNYNNPCDGPNPPAYCFTGGKPIDEEEVVEEEWMMPLAFRAEGGRVGRAYGGIMDKYTGRRAYGLGSIFKKAKKIFKSPLGKAALLGLGGWGLSKLGAGGLGLMGKMQKAGGFGKWLSGISTGKIAAGIGGISLATALLSPPVDEDNDGYDDKTGFDVDEWRKKGARGSEDVPIAFRADGGDAESGLMDLGGMEKDYRADGGFVPIGKKERADDVPARLSKNEFVFTADAVRNAGGGDVDKGAEVMYNVMKNLEAGGDVSEETQGLDGARQMFQTSQRLEEVL